MITWMILAAILALGSCQSGCSNGMTPPTGYCPRNQRWVNCELGYCAPKTCDDLGYPVACPDIVGPCDGGCVCIQDYLKNSQGVCIPQLNCPRCRGDYNATAGDGLYCGNLCSNYFEDQSQFDECRQQEPVYNGCKCKPGFVYNDIIEQCVDPNDCPKPCNGDYYAERQSCPSACQPTCATPLYEVCGDVCNPNQCVCIQGYVLDKDGGKCIKIDDCPDNLGCNGDPNAIITSCGGCPQTCEQKNGQEEPTFCAAVCVPLVCTCKSGFIPSTRDKRCISESECSQRANSSGTT